MELSFAPKQPRTCSVSQLLAPMAWQLRSGLLVAIVKAGTLRKATPLTWTQSSGSESPKVSLMAACHTLSNARKEDDGGPRPLQLPGDRDIYGSLARMLAFRAADIFLCFYELGKLVILEHPARPEDEGAISVLNPAEFKRILVLEGVRQDKVLQCNYGSSLARDWLRAAKGASELREGLFATTPEKRYG